MLKGKSVLITGSLGGIGFAARLAALQALGVNAAEAPDIVVNNAVVHHFGAVENFPPNIGMRLWRSTCPPCST